MDVGLNPVWAAIVTFGAVFFAWSKRLDPRLLLAWLNEPTMKPMKDDIAYIKAVVDELPGAKKAKAAAKAKREGWAP